MPSDFYFLPSRSSRHSPLPSQVHPAPSSRGAVSCRRPALYFPKALVRRKRGLSVSCAQGPRAPELAASQSRARPAPLSRVPLSAGCRPQPRHGECSVGREALPQLPAASPGASVDRGFSGRGARPRAGTTSRQEVSCGFSPLSLSALCHPALQGPFCCHCVLSGFTASKVSHPLPGDA